MKKTTISLIALFAVADLCEAKLGERWMMECSKLAERTERNPSRENILALGKQFIGVEYYNSNSMEERAAMGRISATLLALPGHAQYFADLIEAERAALKPWEGNTYDLHRCGYLRDTLGHLPSPETVKVLGHYLDDDRDTPPPPGPNQDYGDMPANSIVALEALLCLGMRDAPAPPGRYLDSNKTPTVLAAVRAWFAPIKSGEKPFSFKGQAVEYRFKPDGTWVSTPIANPPDDAPKPAPPHPLQSPSAPAAASDAAPVATGHSPPWPWLLGVALLVLPAAAWFLKARRRAAAALSPPSVR